MVFQCSHWLKPTNHSIYFASHWCFYYVVFICSSSFECGWFSLVNSVRVISALVHYFSALLLLLLYIFYCLERRGERLRFFFYKYCFSVFLSRACFTFAFNGNLCNGNRCVIFGFFYFFIIILYAVVYSQRLVVLPFSLNIGLSVVYRFILSNCW